MVAAAASGVESKRWRNRFGRARLPRPTPDAAEVAAVRRGIAGAQEIFAAGDPATLSARSGWPGPEHAAQAAVNIALALVAPGGSAAGSRSRRMKSNRCGTACSAALTKVSGPGGNRRA